MVIWDVLAWWIWVKWLKYLATKKNCKKVKMKIEKRCENLFGYREMLRKLKENDKIGIYIKINK